MEYAVLSKCYDTLVDADYEGIARFYEEIWRQCGVSPGIVLDLGCGTGNLLPLLEREHQVIGVDISPEMLDVAREKAGCDTLLLCQDMTALDLFGTVDAAVCSLDAINALPGEEDVVRALSRVNLFLSGGGLLIFDVNTPYKFERVLDGRVFVYDTDEVYLVWENDYDKDAALCDFWLTFFFPQGDGSYRRAEECITERVYTADQLSQMVRKSGLELVAVYADKRLEPPSPTEERLYFVARKGKDAPNQITEK